MSIGQIHPNTQTMRWLGLGSSKRIQSSLAAVMGGLSDHASENGKVRGSQTGNRIETRYAGETMLTADWFKVGGATVVLAPHNIGESSWVGLGGLIHHRGHQTESGTTVVHGNLREQSSDSCKDRSTCRSSIDVHPSATVFHVDCKIVTTGDSVTVSTTLSVKDATGRKFGIRGIQVLLDGLSLPRGTRDELREATAGGPTHTVVHTYRHFAKRVT
mmetsp:Transcript_17512/g.44623  ORF Transcript_17512/g.44623 Transcript_17512/m.44623 type:complete len:216 (-) Transcript_17512:1694-2341(-)